MLISNCRGFLCCIIATCCVFITTACGGKKYTANDGEVILSNSFELISDNRLFTMPVEPLPIVEDACMNTTDFDYQNAGISMQSYSKIDVGQYKRKFSRNGKFDFYLHPIICNGFVYDIKKDAEIVAYKLENKKVKKLWSKETLSFKEKKDVLISQARLDEETIYIATGNGFVLAFNIEEKKVIWKRKFNTIFSASPTIYNNILYLISSDDELYAIDKTNGELLWKTDDDVKDTKKSFQIPPVAVFQNKVVAGFSNGILAVYNENGNLLWKNKILSAKGTEDEVNDIDFPPILVNHVLIAGGLETSIMGFDFKTGQPLWQIPTGLNSYMLVNRQGLVFSVNNKNENVCFMAQNGLIKSVKQQDKFINTKVSGYLNDGKTTYNQNVNRYFDAYWEV